MPKLSIMVKPASSRCNLNCQYCFYRDEASNRTVADYGVMDNETFDLMLNKAVSFAQSDGIHITFQGGEPLLAGKEFFADAFNSIASCCDENISVSVQTNGILLDAQWAQMFKSNNVLVGISLDGNKRANRYRARTDGGNSFESIIKGINYLKAAKVEFNALIVATPLIAKDIAEVYAFFKRNKIKYLQFIPCLATLGGDRGLTMTPQEYGDMLNILFSLYCNDYKSGEYVSIRYFDNLINAARLGHCEQCGLGGVCMQQYVVEANGNVYPCDFYCLDGQLLGNINTDSFSDFQAKSHAFIQNVAMQKDECTICPYYKLCRGGGCKRERMSADYCQAYKIFFSHNYNNLINF